MAAFILASSTHGGVPIRLEKDVAYGEINMANAEDLVVTFKIFTSSTAPDPVAEQDFQPGQWWAEYDFKIFRVPTSPWAEGAVLDVVRFKADFTDTDSITNDMVELWLEIELNSNVVGQRERIPLGFWTVLSSDNYWKKNGFDIYYNDGMVTIGRTTVPNDSLEIYGTTKHMDIGAGGASIILGETGAGSMARISGENTQAAGGSFLIETTDPTYIFQRRFVIRENGNVGIGTTAPDQKLHVEGNVKADGWITGDIVFQKGDTKLWRMFEEEDGLYLENLKTRKTFKVILENDINSLKKEIIQEVMTKLKSRSH